MLIVVTGGAASGKSEAAERICTRIGKKIAYVATMQPFGKDAAYRIARHLKLREGKGFLTVEQYTNISGVYDQLGSKADTLLLECMSNLCANELFSEEGAGAQAGEAILNGVKMLSEHYQNVIIVTNEVFSDGIIYEKETMQYIQLLGQVNTALAEMADGVAEVFCGIPSVLKDQTGRLKGWIVP